MVGRLGRWTSRALYAILTLMLLGIVLVIVREIALYEQQILVPVLAVAVGAIAVLFIAAMLTARFGRQFFKRSWVLPLALTLLCLAVKLAAVFIWRTEPQGDYKTFHIVASDLASGEMSLSRYVALFPHIFGYSSFLSLFFRVFGNGHMVAPIVNAALSAVSALLLYHIARMLISKRAGVVAAGIWTLFPSQTLFNIHALSEPLYTAGLLLAALVFIGLHRELRAGRGATLRVLGLAALIGAVLWTVNLSRPIAIIPIIAIAAILLVIDLPFKNAMPRVAALSTLCVVYLALGVASDAWIEHSLGEAPSKTAGYSIAVGFNEASNGRWNIIDSELLTKEYSSLSAEDAQRAMLEVAKQRIFSGEINWPRLLYRKYASLYSHDDTPVIAWGREAFSPNNKNLSIFCNGYYLASVTIALMYATASLLRHSERVYASECAGIPPTLKRGKRMKIGVRRDVPVNGSSADEDSGASRVRTRSHGRAIVPLDIAEHYFTLYAIGLTAAQMLVEVAYRYHYSVLIMLCFAGAAVFEAASKRF